MEPSASAKVTGPSLARLAARAALVCGAPAISKSEEVPWRDLRLLQVGGRLGEGRPGPWRGGAGTSPCLSGGALILRP